MKIKSSQLTERTDEMVENITAFPLDQDGLSQFPSIANTVPFFLCYNPFLMNIQRWPKSLQVAVFIFCDLLQESNLVSSAAVCVMSIWICNGHLICFVHLCVCTHTHLYLYNIYTVYMWTYIEVCIHVYIVSVYCFNWRYAELGSDTSTFIFPCSLCVF